MSSHRPKQSIDSHHGPTIVSNSVQVDQDRARAVHGIVEDDPVGALRVGMGEAEVVDLPQRTTSPAEERFPRTWIERVEINVCQRLARDLLEHKDRFGWKSER